MKKNTTKIFIAAVFLTISGTAYAQEGSVGINTSTPAATLDVVASPTVSTRVDGLIAPRLKGTELQSKNALYTAAQDGAIVYVTEVLTATDDKTLNVTSIGYYYFDKTVGTAGRWMKIANPTAVVAYQEPWNNASDNQPATSNTSDIYQLGKVGINTNSPSNNLHVKGTSPGNNEVIVKVEDNNMSSGNKVLIKLGKNDSGKKDAADIKYYYDADNSNSNRIDFGFSGNSESMSLTSQGNFGIGTTLPAQRLDVNGTAKAVNLTNGGTALGTNDFGLYSQTPTWMRYVTAATDHAWYTDGASGNNYGGTNPSMLLSLTGNLGIGTTNPSQKLDVNGASRLRGQIYDNNNAAGANGQVLSTNSSGQVVWQNNIAITPMVIGVMNLTAPSNPINSAYYNTGSYINLPQGKWVVNTTMLLRKTGGLLTSDAALWIRAGFSTSTTSYLPAGNILSGSLVGPSNFGLMNGIVVINNASGSTQRYYLWRTTSQANGTATGNEVLANFAGGWGENQIVATPVN